jgi:hypothetical protein
VPCLAALSKKQEWMTRAPDLGSYAQLTYAKQNVIKLAVLMFMVFDFITSQSQKRRRQSRQRDDLTTT